MVKLRRARSGVFFSSYSLLPLHIRHNKKYIKASFAVERSLVWAQISRANNVGHSEVLLGKSRVGDGSDGIRWKSSRRKALERMSGHQNCLCVDKEKEKR